MFTNLLETDFSKQASLHVITFENLSLLASKEFPAREM